MKKLLAILVLGFSLSQISAQDEKIEITMNGYVKYMQTSSFVSIDTMLSDNLIHNRLNFRVYAPGNLTLGAEFRNRVFYGDTYRVIPNYAEQVNDYDGALNLNWIWEENASWAMTTVTDRLWLNWQNDRWEARVGRQRINWGVNLVWNPNDLFNNFNYLDFDYEERPGADAIRVQHYFTGMSTLDFAFKWASDRDSNTWALKYGFNKKGYDVQLLAGKFQSFYTAGLGWAGSIKDWGFKGEASLFMPEEPSDSLNTSLSLSPSLDYTFKSGWYIMGSYLLNTNGSDEEAGALSFYNQLPDARNLMPNTHTFMGQTSKSFSPVFTGSLAVMYGAGVNWLIAFPTLTYSVRDDFDLDLVTQHFWGETQAGNFESGGNALFFRFRWSF